MIRKIAGIAGATLLACPLFADSFVITGARVADGAGRALELRNVRVEGASIVAVGKLVPRKGERIVRADGLVLAPGFIGIARDLKAGDHQGSSRGCWRYRGPPPAPSAGSGTPAEGESKKAGLGGFAPLLFLV